MVPADSAFTTNPFTINPNGNVTTCVNGAAVALNAVSGGKKSSGLLNPTPAFLRVPMSPELLSTTVAPSASPAVAAVLCQRSRSV